jgi:hypothetical protein
MAARLRTRRRWLLLLDRIDRVVMPAHSGSKNGVASLAYVASIHVFAAGQQRRG